MNRNLNIHIGLRWEPFMPERDTFGRGSYFSQSAFIAGTKTAKYTNAPPGLFFNGDPGIPYGYINNQVQRLFSARRSRLGSQAEMAAKASEPPTASSMTDRTRSSMRSTPTLRRGATKSRRPVPRADWRTRTQGYPGGNPFPAPLASAKDAFFPAAGVYVNFPIDTQPTYVQQWGLSYQLQVAKDWLLSANYIGNKSTHLWAQYDANHAIYIPGNCNGGPCSTLANVNSRRTLGLLNPTAGALFGAIDTLDDGANANYNALIIKAQHRFSQNFTLLASYTYSHCLQDSQLVVNDLGNGPLYQNPLNRNADYGACDFDLRHSVVSSLVIASPRFTDKWTNMILGDWQLSPIITAHGGFPFTPSAGQDNSRTGEGADRPDIVGNPYVRNLDTRTWLSPSAFAPNGIGAFGNAGWNSLRGPSFFNIDVGLSRSFRIRESQALQLRFEFFNATNHVNFSNPGSNISVSNFGTILSAGDPRILQFALKYTF